MIEKYVTKIVEIDENNYFLKNNTIQTFIH